MSQKEFQRVKVIENAAGGRLSVGEAARLLCNSVNGRCSGSSDATAPALHGLGATRQPRAVPCPGRPARRLAAIAILQLARGKSSAIPIFARSDACFSTYPPYRRGRRGRQRPSSLPESPPRALR